MGIVRDFDLDTIVKQMVLLSTAERTSALTHLFNLRTAALEDLSDLGENKRHWDTVVGPSVQPDNVKALIRALTKLTEEELAIVSARVFEKSTVAREQILQTADDKERERLQAQLAARTEQARESYVATKQNLNMKHKAKLAEKMKDVRDAIEEGINAHKDVTVLEEIFARMEDEFWEQYPDSSVVTRIKNEEY